MRDDAENLVNQFTERIASKNNERMKKSPKIYSIGQKQDYKYSSTTKKTNTIEKKLSEIGFEVVNPLTI